MKILFLTPQIPYPPQQGTTIRNYNIIRELSTRHQLHLLCFGQRSELEGSPLKDLCTHIQIVSPPSRSFARRAVETLTSPLPDMARRLHSPEMTAALGGMLVKNIYDVIQIEGIEMADAWMNIEGSRGEDSKNYESAAGSDSPHAIVVFDDHNAEYILQKSAFESDRLRVDRLHGAVYSFVQWRKLARFERDVCLRARNVAVVSDEDARALSSLDARIEPVLIPNGVDLVHYVPSEDVCAKPLADLSTVFTGKMDFRPNVDAAVWFANEILPVLRKEIPLAHVSFVGQNPSPAVRSLGSRSGVEVTGRVADTRPYIADAAVYIVPLRMGGGTRLKVLEAMAMGKAIVSTTIGAAGITCVSGRDLVIADEPKDFAGAVCSLMREPARRKELGANARKLVEKSYDWRKIVPKFEAIYEPAR